MKSKIDKTHILKVCVEKQQELIDSFKQREAEMYKDTLIRMPLLVKLKIAKPVRLIYLKPLEMSLFLLKRN